ncbi:hypothetical protein Ocin01_19405 [Orchesella cincta]|uniref:GPR158/179 extracellular domain-containing protein n=1 Tax=Orchesella cincta TaxID=48709 RepID=A0A1D2M2T2_ORCCI|nr:hypothetical protein Ocin01_19405 [Orchesella cincta]
MTERGSRGGGGGDLCLTKPIFFLLIIFFSFTYAQFGWQTRDNFDEIRRRYDAATPDNCAILPTDRLYLSKDSEEDDTVTHKPDIKEININPVFPNRTALLHLHNVAMSRAFFWSYILQSRFIRPAINDTYDPGMMYYFLSTVADVSSNLRINSSAIYFSTNASFSPSYRGFFNKTFPLFAPRTYRADDFNDPIHLERISTLNTFLVKDLGAVPPHSLSRNYTTDFYRINEWYKLWLPDNVGERHDTKTTYQVEIRYANNTNETYTFHGPPGADETPGPVKWTRPYYDCGRSDKWIIGAVVPIADIYPRHTGFRHIEYPTYTAAAVLEMDFERIDINQCPLGEGNLGPNKFSGTARCREETTECEPLDGYGFRRGGYQCRCRPGFRLPFVDRRPFLGEIIERSSEISYRNFFKCDKIDWIQTRPVEWDVSPAYIRVKYMEKYNNYKNFSFPTNIPDPEGVAIRREKNLDRNTDALLRFINSVNPKTCHNLTKQDLILNGDIAFGAQSQFENEALMAPYLQIVDPSEVFPGKRVPDKPLSEDQMIGETLALVLGDTKIWSAASYWDRNKFPNRTLFAPFAYKKDLNTRKFKVEDLARVNDTKDVYLNKEFYKFLKNRWATNLDELEKYYLKMHMRNNETGEFLRKFEQYPTFYRAANKNHGFWTTPYYDCKGLVPKWLITYAVPFFGWDSLRVNLEFKGVVAVSMDLLQLDINQCDDDYYVPNFFKGTHKCHRRTSYCVPILGRGFDTGGYKCECYQGYEYPFDDPITYFDGQLVEAEFLNLVWDNKTRYDMLKCRLAGASSVVSSYLLIAGAVLASVLQLLR